MSGRFPDQRPDEQVLAIVRPHWLVILPAILLTGALGLLPPFVVWGVNAVDLGVNGPGAAVGITIISAFYLTLATYFYIRWLDYYLDVGVVTDKRVVDIDQLGLFRRNVDELDRKVIQDVTVSRHGFLQTIFNFGNLEIQTAGERRNFEFRGIPNPEKVQHLVARAQDKRDDGGGGASGGSGTDSQPGGPAASQSKPSQHHRPTQQPHPTKPRPTPHGQQAAQPERPAPPKRPDQSSQGLPREFE